MKVVRETPDQLIVENNPVGLAIFVSVFGLVFFGIGLSVVGSEPGTGLAFMAGGLGIAIGFNMIFVRRTQLILDTSRNLVELRRRGWLGYSSQTWELQYLERVIVETSRSGDSDTHRAALVISDGMDAGTHPVTWVYSSGRGAERAQNAVNGWLDSYRLTA
ncbi:MAG: hypothetical protein WA782_03660 [Sulfitobacter sp.]